MPLKAYLLIVAEVGMASAIVDSLSQLPEVSQVHRVTGQFDVIAVVEVADMQSVGTFVTRSVHGVEGVRNTLTCIKVDS